MTVFWVFGGIAGLCVIVILGSVPELLAAALTGACILTPYYAMGGNTVTDTIELEMRDGKPYVTTAPLPEHIGVSRGLWDAVEDYEPETDGDTGLEPPAGLWRETLQHAGAVDTTTGRPTDAPTEYVLHINAENVTAAYRVGAVPDGAETIVGTLVSWGEK